MTDLPRARVLVADDEALSLGLACETLEQDPRFEIVARCADGSTALAEMRRNMVDVAVLDIRMPGIDGRALARLAASEAQCPGLVFVSAFGEHALEAFEIGVCDYVTKPYEPERLRRAVWRAATRRANGAEAQPLEHLIVRTHASVDIVELGDIEVIDADDKEVWLQHREGRRYRYPSTLSALAKALACPPFVRMHRSHVVNLRHIVRLRDASSRTGVITLTSGATTPLSRRYRRKLSSLFFALR
jgi:DNA-binding LytR/AlgR family response regulator